MVEYDIVLNNIRLRVICDQKYISEINKLMLGHAYIEEAKGTPTYRTIIHDNSKTINGQKFKLIDKWFDNATADVYINNIEKTVYLVNMDASNIKNKNLLVQYFICNVFNRLLEEQGYYAFHSSSVEKNGNGIAFVGRRNVGKTNCMLNMMNDGFNSVTNDKLGIQYDDRNLNGYGIAQDVSIRMDKSFRDQIRNKKYIPFAEREGVALSEKNKLDGNSIHLDSVELAKLNGVNQVPTTKIKNIIFPKYDKTIRKVKVTKVNSYNSKIILLDQSLPMVHETTSFLKYIHSTDVQINSKDKTIDKMCTLDNYEIIQGENSTEDFIKTVKKITNI